MPLVALPATCEPTSSNKKLNSLQIYPNSQTFVQILLYYPPPKPVYEKKSQFPKRKRRVQRQPAELLLL